MRSLLTLPVVLLLAACHQPPQPDAADAVQSLKEADAAISAAVVERDLEKIVAFYATDATMLPTAEPQINGIAAIREEWKHVLGIPDFESRTVLTKAEVASSGDFGYTMGTYVAVMMGEDGNPVSEPGKWLTVWKKQSDGSWKIAVDTYNTDLPPPDHK